MVVEQSLIYMMVSYVVAVLLAIVVYRATQELAGIPMRLTTAQPAASRSCWPSLVGLLSGFLSLSKLRAAQPAELF